MSRVINWFEIPAVDLERAANFYSTVLGVEIGRGEFMGIPHGFFPNGDKAVTSGAIVQNGTTPAAEGTLLYLNAEEGLDPVLARVEPAGGQVVLPKTSLGDPGYMAIIVDTEGNRIGLHAFS